MSPVPKPGPEYQVIDLRRDFDSPFLSDEGVLEISPQAEHDIHLWLGDTALVISWILAPDMVDSEAEAQNTYSVRNKQAGAAFLFDDALVPAEDGIAEGYQDVFVPPSPHVIGRETTPELGLSKFVGRRHVELFTGALQRNLHIRDLGSTNGTWAAVHEEDLSAITHPHRKLVPFRRGAISLAKSRGCWLRDS